MTRSAADIRREFLEFFAQRGHTICPPSPVVPHDDPTLLFTNAGMNQFKPIFLGQRAPDVDRWPGVVPGMPTRAADSQPCIRAGGKHNDLDDVGHDTYHHTFFEMLGNWSFGDYFKRDAIAWAWELFTKVWGIDKTRLHATYFGGDPAEGLEPDFEARDLWKEVTGLPDAHVHPGNKKDNFWEMGDTGPCGPCSEIHIDLTPDKSGAKLVNAGDARVMEIWNLVFIQFNSSWLPGGETRMRDWDREHPSAKTNERNAFLATCRRLDPLPAKHVDTGMGFERVTAILQGKRSNYDTDIFTPIFAAIQKVTGAPAYSGQLQPMKDGKPDSEAMRDLAIARDVSYRVIADHIRTLTFAITDGAVPDKEGRGYVLRRILRRAVRYGWQYLNTHEPFLYKLVPAVVDAMGAAFLALQKKSQQVVEVIRDEEQSFGHTLDRGIALFEEAAEISRKDHHGRIRGEDAFKLHDTYGFPIDLTEIMAHERGLSVDIGEYERLMESARNRARAASSEQSVHNILADVLQKETLPRTEFLYTDGQGVFTYRGPSWLFRITPAGYERLEKAQAGEPIAFVVQQTSFYAESGGQIGDRGTIAIGETGAFLEITDTQKVGDVYFHLGTVRKGVFNTNPAELIFSIDSERRQPTMKNHTATHLMNWALREVLGDHVQQKGSLVDPEKTRFDLSHPKPLTPEEIARVEELTNEQIGRALQVDAEILPLSLAQKINGVRAVFGEKYPDPVRVISVGKPLALLKSVALEKIDAVLNHPDWRNYSVEFCGGTHVSNTSQIRRFAIVAEEGVAKGVRRVVGITGDAAEEAEKTAQMLLRRIEQIRTGPPEQLAAGAQEIQTDLTNVVVPVRDRPRLREALAGLQDSLKQQQKTQAAAGIETLNARVDELLPNAAKIGATTVFVAELPDAPAEQLKQAVDRIKQIHGSAAVLIGVRTAGDEKSPPKAVLLAAVTDDLVKKGVKAGDWIKAVAPLVEGGGGGPPTMAQAGGKNPAKLAEALEAGRAWIQGKNL